MTTTGLDVFDKSLQETNHWLRLMMVELQSDDRREAYVALRATLHALRDRIGAMNAVHLGAQLPLILRGVFYEGWRPTETPTRERHLEQFIDHVGAELPDDEVRVKAGEVARACFSVMSQCLDRGEMKKLRGMLPHEVLNLWPDSLLR